MFTNEHVHWILLMEIFNISQVEKNFNWVLIDHTWYSIYSSAILCCNGTQLYIHLALVALKASISMN